MPILGKAIARYLKDLRGLYSVELPSRLKQELAELVVVCNEVGNKRALLVSDIVESQVTIENVTSWAELLKWRTDDDRIFAWERGYKEPDTSFQSVVRPFVSNRFPGEPRGECTLDLLAKLSIKELWAKYDLPTNGETYDAFLETARWVAGVLKFSFERVGSIPSAHWSDQFLVHWAEMLNLVDKNLQQSLNQGVSFQPRHAWELVRISGLIVPTEIIKEGSGNIFLSKPPKALDKSWPDIARRWQDIAEEHLLTESSRAVLLMALDDVVKGTDKTSSWRGLCWEALIDISVQDLIAAPVIGLKIFANEPSPSLISDEKPTYPVAPKPSWWGVTEADIKNALDKLQKTTYFRPSSTCTQFISLNGQSDIYWLQTRSGDISHAHSKGNWKADVTIKGLEMVFKAPWAKLVVSAAQPAETTQHTWIDPNNITLAFNGREIKTAISKVTIANADLIIEFDLTITYGAKLDDSTGEIVGKKWNPVRTLQIMANVQDFDNDSAKYSKRKVDSSVKIIVPSPFSPTLTVLPSDKGKIMIAPSSGDVFMASTSTGIAWNADATPDVILKEEGTYAVEVYDGRIDPITPSFMPELVPVLNGNPLSPAKQGSNVYGGEQQLDDGDVISTQSFEIAAVKVRERSGNLSSGLLSVIRGLPAGRKPPSSQAKTSFPGQYQVQIARALSNPPATSYNSLYQYVVTTNDELSSWPDHPGGPSPLFISTSPESFILPGIGNGPSKTLIETKAWPDFMHSIKEVCQALGLKPGAEQTWISGIDPSIVPASLVRKYTTLHADLIRAAKNVSLADAFWASYPFSVIILDGSTTANFGQLQALLLSPLHPARLAWAYTVAFTAKHSRSISKEGSQLVGLAEGWNIPLTGFAVSIAGQKTPLVSIPIDPGIEQDFATWSALAVLGNDGLASLPQAAMGLPLPWGGQTGINQKVISQAIKDYLAVHPHLNSLEIDIRSISSAPRSREIDTTILELLGGEAD